MPDKSTAQVYLEQAQGRLKELGELLTKATPGGPYENDVWATIAPAAPRRGRAEGGRF